MVEVNMAEVSPIIKKTRQRGYSIVAERDATVARALTKILKHTASESDEQEESKDKLVSLILRGGLIVRVFSRTSIPLISVSWSSKESFNLPLPSPASLSNQFPRRKLSRIPHQTISSFVSNTPSTPTIPTSNNLSSTTSLELLTPTTADLPDIVVYETSYANYPLILASGGIRKAGGQAHLSFACIAILTNGTETRTSLSTKDDADISIYISLKTIMDSQPQIKWYRNGSGGIISEGDENGVLSKSVWKRVVARRSDIGVLFEDGVVKKEVPVGLRGKGVKGRRRREGKGKWVE
ncbi:hypothetical protein DID88_005512 [Monilinia fructigena]|uniref:Uncharacterized protein n=1 Tax=Monilinia fructigena TaxID=38457 RepID=A0A395J5B9_9HELO|nr:hypothetical protein DID88_005512 [Monilinia fructigena]